MKVVNAGYNYWDILSDDGKVLGNIKRFEMIRSSHKVLYAGEDQTKKIGEVRNQSQAIEELKKFFEQNKVAIEVVENAIKELEEGKEQVTSTICKQALEHERINQMSILEDLKSYDLL